MAVKDGWDKADTAGKLISGLMLGTISVALGFFTFFYQKAESEKANALKKGELIQKMIGELLQTDEGIKRDVVLIALDNSIDMDDPVLADIVEHLYRNSSDPSDKALKVAFRILEKRRPELAKEINNEAQEKLLNAETRAEVRSLPGEIPAGNELPVLPKKSDGPVSPTMETQKRESPVLNVARQIAAASPKQVVYIQYKNAALQSKMNELKETLAGQGFFAPGVEHVDRNYANSIRYFNKEDAAQAAQIAQMVSDFFKACGGPAFSPVEFKGFKAPKGQIEVWINLDCLGA